MNRIYLPSIAVWFTPDFIGERESSDDAEGSSGRVLDDAEGSLCGAEGGSFSLLVSYAKNCKLKY